MSHEHDRLLLQSLHHAVEQLHGVSTEDMSNVRTYLVRIADAAHGLSAEFQRSHPSIPWLVLGEMGAVIRRAGDHLDPQEVSATLQQEIPQLQQRLMGL